MYGLLSLQATPLVMPMELEVRTMASFSLSNTLFSGRVLSGGGGGTVPLALFLLDSPRMESLPHQPAER